MVLKSASTIGILTVLILLGIGIFFVMNYHNTIVVENTNAAQHEPVVYKSAQDSLENPEDLVAPESSARVRVLPNSVGYLNVRADATVNSTKIGQVDINEEFEYTESKNNWYHIILTDDETGWVSGQYVQEVE